ncbi:hypothetical protein MXB_5008 [Myxobolus squamalis]|nr:hypothetical protein MXB_5008 [Myxobolus squamalis]
MSIFESLRMLPENTTEVVVDNSNFEIACDKSKTVVEKISQLRCQLLEIEKEIHKKIWKKKLKKYYNDLSDFFDYLRSNNVLKGSHEIDSVCTDENHLPTFTIEENAPTYQLEKMAKIVACFFSQSISMISSALDSGVDILSSAISFFTSHKIQKLNLYKHPQGKTRMIPLSIIIISVVMSITSLRVVMEILKRIITKTDLIPEFSIVAVTIVIITIISKTILFVWCTRIKTPTAQLIAQDSRNDVLTNAAVLIGLFCITITK